MTDAMTTQKKLPRDSRTPNTLKNTLKCVLVLGVIAVVCVALLAVANRFLKVEVTLDKATAKLINQIAPTGADDDTAYSSYIKMVDLSKGAYKITDLDEYNKTYGSNAQKVRALYTSTHKDTGKVTLVVESEGKGYVDAIVMLVAYDEDSKVSGLVTKSQNESFWNHIPNEETLYKAYIGTSGTVSGNSIAAQTGVTVMGTLGGITSAVNIANDFVTRLGGAVQAPAVETDTAKITLLKKVSSATEFTRYTINTAKVANVFKGDNGDYIVEAKSGTSGYGEVTLLVRIENDTVKQIAYVDSGFSPEDGHDSAPLKNNDTLNSLFAEKTLQDLNGMNASSLAGTTGVTESGKGLIAAVKNALEYEFTEEA